MRRLILLLILGALGFCSWFFWPHLVANRDFKRLLQGSKDVFVVSLDIEGTVLSDPASLRYLSEMFRSPQVVFVPDVSYDGSDLGVGYFASFRLSTHASVTCSLHVSKKKDRLVFHFPIYGFEEGSYYLVTLKEPVPEPLARMLWEMR
jgi:hypothetical protein